MKFEVYCDEALPDLFSSRAPKGQYLMIGSLWLPAELREEAKRGISELRRRHQVFGEMKWRKISPAKQGYYTEVINLFLSFGSDMRFRCIAVDREQFNRDRTGGDPELGFYKFYYQVLHHWILDNNEYSIFCDLKVNRDRNRISTLHKVLSQANRNSQVTGVQSLPSEEVALLQMCDVLLGIASSRLNSRESKSDAKEAIIRHLEGRLDRHRIGPTPRTENKFNIFRIQLQGGW